MKASFNEIAARLGSESSSLTIIDTLLTDSGSLTRPESSVFFAIATPGGNDGHNYIRELYDRGVTHFVANFIPESMASAEDANFIRSTT